MKEGADSTGEVTDTSAHPFTVKYDGPRVRCNLVKKLPCQGY